MKHTWTQRIILITMAIVFILPASVCAQDGGSVVFSELWCKAVLKVSGNPVTLKWKSVGQDTTPSGDHVVSGYFYADPNDFAYGSTSNPEVFVKIYSASSGWTNMAFNHVTVDAVDIYSAYQYSGAAQKSSTITLSSRLAEHQYTIQSQDPGCNTSQFPLVISNLSFPSSVKQDSYQNGSVSYVGDFQRIANPVMALRLSESNSTITTYMMNNVTVDGCTLNFEVHIPKDVSGNGTLRFKLVDYDSDIPSGQNNFDDNGVSNELSQYTPITN